MSPVVAEADRITIARFLSTTASARKTFARGLTATWQPVGDVVSAGRSSSPHALFRTSTALFTVLTDEAAKGDRFVLMGEPIRLGGPQRRLTNDDPATGKTATLREAPRQWLRLDFDTLPPPPGSMPAS